MQRVGYMILVFFYLCYFIKMFQQRRQGIQTDHLGKGKHGLEKKIEVGMKCASILVFLVEIISIYLNMNDSPMFIRIIGMIIGILGDFVFIVSVRTMKESWRAGVSYDEKTSLVTSGIYRISRNPAFLGFDLVYIGICLMFFNLVLGMISLFSIIMFHLQIKYVEEPFLKSVFKEEYLQYYQQVHRYLGRKRQVF